MKSSYDIRREMENEFGKDFIKTMENKKQQFEKYQKELKDAESFEEKIEKKREKLRKTFLYISDNHNIYPEETCSHYLHILARECVEQNLSEEEEHELYIEKQKECLNDLESEANELIKTVKQLREQVEDEETTTSKT